MSGPSQKGSLCSDGSFLVPSHLQIKMKAAIQNLECECNCKAIGNSGWAHRHPCPAAPSFGDGEQRSTLHVPARVPLFVFGFVYLCLALDTLSSKTAEEIGRERDRSE